MSPFPDDESFGMKNDRIISDWPEPSVVLKEPIPRLVKSESNKLIVTSEGTLESELRITLTNPSLPFVNEETTTSLLKEIISDEFDVKKYKKIPTRQQRIGLLRAMTINKLVSQAAATFFENEPEILKGKFDSPLKAYSF